jgi:hypothetical protein
MEKNQVLTRKLVSRGVFFLLLVAFIPFLSAQSRGVWKKSYDLKIGLGQGSRLLWSTTPTMRSTYTAQGLSDSFRSHDQWTNLMSYGISVNFSQSDKK